MRRIYKAAKEEIIMKAQPLTANANYAAIALVTLQQIVTNT